MLDQLELRQIYAKSIRKDRMMEILKKQPIQKSKSILQANKNLIKYQLKPIIEDGISKQGRC